MEKELEKNLDQELGAELETVEAPKKPSFLRKLRNHRGFSLVEMAIVMVIIGIIIAAIVKGQDLVLNAQAKKVISTVSTWRNLTLTFLDRNGRFPGDQNKNGIIGDQAAPIVENTDATSAIAELSAAGMMQDLPANPIVVGSSSFWVYIGNTTTTDSGARNAMIICGSVDCKTAFTNDQIEIIKTIDTAIDGFADSGSGQFRVSTALPTLTPNPPVTLVNGRMTATFTGAAVVSAPNTTAAAPAAWATGATVGAAVWLFDKPY